MPAEHVEYRRARKDDLAGVAEVFIAAFPESVEHYVGQAIGPAALVDVFAICLDAEPEAFIVADVDGAVYCYVFAPVSMSGIFRTAVVHGHLLVLLWGWIGGRYGIGFQPVRVAVRNWLSLWGQHREGEHRTDAHILSIAVAPGAQGKGLGTGLMKEALKYLTQRGVHVVRLEVRPDNLPAIRIYEKLGFETRGRTGDTQGEWLIMIKDMASDEAG
jgi:ribosomal protein S18 acetylase RimI-like enzyme